MASAMAGKKMGRASYIRIKHEEERHEASWKEPEGWVFSATTRTDVAARLGELRDQILAGCASPSRPRRTALRLLLRPPRRRPSVYGRTNRFAEDSMNRKGNRCRHRKARQC
nr:peptidyl-prolyl cis-trans isomerase Pin1-like [Aegilops tauschii subsp. strangulata]